MNVEISPQGPTAALEGIRVLDLTCGVAGPLAAMHLADFGADVIKVEPPEGDPGRSRPGFAMWNRNKRSVVVDPASTRDVAWLRDLLRGADIIVTNNIGGPFAQFASPDVTRELNPTLIHLLLPAYLEQHRWAGGIESADLVWAMSGMAQRQSSYEGGPVDNVAAYILYIQGAWGAAAAMAALIERQSSGHGQTVTVGGLHATMLAYAYIIDPTSPDVLANYGPGGLNPLYTRYQCADGKWILLACLTAKFSMRALDLLGLSHVMDDERVGGDFEATRLPSNRTWIRALIAERFATRPSEEWLDELTAAGIPAGPLLERDDWMDSPLLEPIGARLEVEDPERGVVVMPANPINMMGTPARVRRVAPRLGQSTAELAPWPTRDWAGMTPPAGDSPLSGVRVLNLGTVLAGPFTGTLLADLGADVIKVELRDGDGFRLRGMPYIRGQRGLAIDLKAEEGLATFLRLVETADVVVDNYRAGVLERLQIDYDRLKQVNPEIITVSITGYGENNPYSTQAAFDPLLQARSGMMTAQGGDSEPVMSTVGINDVVTSSLAALGATLALFHRKRGGGGQKVWLSLTGSSTYAQCEELIRVAGREPARVGGRDFRGPGPLDRFYETDDGWLRLLATDEDREKLHELGYLADPHANGADLSGQLAAAFGRSHRDEVLDRLAAAGIAAAPSRRVSELLEDREYEEWHVFDTMHTADGELLYVPGRYARLSRSQHRHELFPPGVGEHTVEILKEAGIDDDTIDSLLSNHVVRQGGPIEYRTFAAYYR